MRKNLIVKFLLIFILFFFLFLFLIYYFQKEKESKVDIYLQQSIKRLYSEFTATKNAYDKLSHFVYNELTNNEKFLTLLKKKDSSALYNYLLPKFLILEKFFISYVALLDIQGNPIVAITPSFKKENIFNKNENKLLFEMKKPIIDKNLLAIFDTAISYNVLKNDLERLFRGYYEYIINKEYLNKNSFLYGKRVFIESDLSKHYFYEKESIHSSSTLHQNIIHSINKLIKRDIAQKLHLHKNFSVLTHFHDDLYIVTFLAIYKQKDHIGYLLSYKKDNTPKIFQETFFINVILSFIIVTILLLFIYHVLADKQKFEKMATIDPLTKAYNRNFFNSISKRELERSLRYNRPLSLIIFDIDNFKKINDTYGHDVGDYVLKVLTQIVQENLRKVDLLFRWGGEEFIVLSSETDKDGALKLAEKLRRKVEEHPFKKLNQVTISIGVASYDPDRDKNIDDLIKRADTALYKSKTNGKNRVTLAS